VADNFHAHRLGKIRGQVKIRDELAWISRIKREIHASENSFHFETSQFIEKSAANYLARVMQTEKRRSKNVRSNL
jgi:hypothetical protein